MDQRPHKLWGKVFETWRRIGYLFIQYNIDKGWFEVAVGSYSISRIIRENLNLKHDSHKSLIG